MGIKVTFDGFDLTQYLEVTEGFTPFDGADFSPVILRKSAGTGDEFVRTRIGSKTIPMPFIVQHDVWAKYDLIQTILNVTEPKELTFSHMPNRVFMAIPKDTLNFEEIFLQGEGVINWLIPSGLGYNPAKTRVTFTKVAPGVLEAELDNMGTEWATVDYNITHNYENGYIGIVSEFGAIQLGDIAEVDKVPAEKSIVLTNNPKGNFSNWKDGTIYYENRNKTAATTMTSDSQFGGRLGILPAGFTNTQNSAYFGAIKEFVWDTPAQHWYIWARARFETGLMGQTGAWGISMVDKNDKMIASMVIEKTDSSGNNATIGFRRGGPNGENVGLRYINFTPSYWIKDNPYGDESRVKNRDMWDMRKEGSRLTFFWYGQYFPFNVPEIANMEATRVQFFIGQFKGRPTVANNSRLVSRMYLNDFSLFQNKVPYMKDVPNRYPKDSVVRIDGATKKPYFNNMLRLSDEVKGSVYFKIPPGKKTKVQIMYSEFSDPAPDAYAVVNEVYI